MALTLTTSLYPAFRSVLSTLDASFGALRSLSPGCDERGRGRCGRGQPQDKVTRVPLQRDNRGVFLVVFLEWPAVHALDDVRVRASTLRSNSGAVRCGDVRGTV